MYTIKNMSDHSYLFDRYTDTRKRKIDLVKIILGTFHIDSYYDEWVDKKMTDFDTFYSHLDNKHKWHYDHLNSIHLMVRDKI